MNWAERVVTEVAVRLGLPVANAELACLMHADATRFGVISKKLLSDNETLIHGNELLAEIEVVGNSAKDPTGYTLGAVRSVLDRVEPPTDGSEFSAWEWFAGFLVLDALVANTDRHQENWAAIETQSGTRRSRRRSTTGPAWVSSSTTPTVRSASRRVTATGPSRHSRPGRDLGSPAAVIRSRLPLTPHIEGVHPR